MSATLRLTRAAFATVQRASPRLAALWAERIFCTPPRRPISERMATWLREGQRFTVTVSRRRVAAWSWGAQGPGVLLVHGWGSRGARFVDLGGALLASGFRVVTFDAPGHGASSGRLSSGPEFARAMRIPLLVIHDRDDREVRWDDGAAITAAWPGAQLVTTTGLGHHRIVSDGGVIQQVLGFLK